MTEQRVTLSAKETAAVTRGGGEVVVVVVDSGGECTVKINGRSVKERGERAAASNIQ